MGKIGFLLQFFSLLVGLTALFFYGVNIINPKDSNDRYGRIALISQTVLLTLSSIILVIALATSDFTLEYVAQYTDRSLPMVYKISAFWAGQAGSLLFWGWLISIVAFIEIFRIKNYSLEHKSGVFFIIALTATFFLVLTNFVTNPFKTLDFVIPDGNGMNPLLQNPGMLYHPPTLYLGFVGLTLPFAHGFASLLTKDTGNFWVKDVRSWTIISWVFLTIGIVLGGQWAYVELGWGGYWAWDPVENASLLPWITATGYLHSALIYEKRGRLKLWTYILAWISFELCIFGTFLTRSGVIDSVHSFGKSSLGVFFIVFMLISSAIYFYYLAKNKQNLTKESEIHLLSREGFFYIGNWIFFGLMLVILFGTTLPILTQFMSQKLTVGIPYYNAVSTPFFMVILLLSGIAPLTPYANSSVKEIVKVCTPSIIFSIILTVAMYLMGYRLLIPLFLFAFTFFSFFTILMQLIKSIKASGVKSIFKNKRYYGALGTHLGVVILAFAVIGSSFYRYEMEKVVKPGETFNFGPYVLQVGNFKVTEKENYTSVMTPTRVVKDGKYIVTIAPERRFYRNNQEAFAEVGIFTKITGDLYIILASYSMNENVIGLQVIWEPFVVWIWIGCTIMVLSALHGAFGRKRE